MTIQLTTVGFTKKSAESFFTLLQNANVKRVVDVRLNNVSQLAGFSKMEDLRYFLRAIANIEYLHVPLLAPTKSMLDAYKKEKGEWNLYEKRFLDLMAQRRIENELPKDVLDGGCLLCSEDKPHHCHRRLVAEYLTAQWGDVNTKHLV